jgi:hypothetical protein
VNDDYLKGRSCVPVTEPETGAHLCELNQATVAPKPVDIDLPRVGSGFLASWEAAFLFGLFAAAIYFVYSTRRDEKSQHSQKQKGKR